MLQKILGKLNMLEMNAIIYVLTNSSFVFWLYIMGAIITETCEENFGTAYETYKQSVKQYSSIRLQDVKDFLGKRDDIQVTSKPETYNSCVSPVAKFEFETDIMDPDSKYVTSNARYGLVSIGNFTKIAEVVPIKNRTPEAMIDGLNNLFISMGKPKQLYSDERSMRSATMVQFINQDEIKYVQTSTHAHTVERFIRTFKYNLHRRLDALEQHKSDWFKHIDNIIKTYNSTEHSIIQRKPNEAGEKQITFG